MPTEKALCRLIAELCLDVEGLPPDVVADVEALVASPSMFRTLFLLPPIIF